nr:MAG TPA_asm: hyaluronidase [Caudoviricetes sp.]
MPAITTIKLRRGTAAAWTSANSVLAAGETGVETDTNKFKFGDGVTAWNLLPYAVAAAGAGTVVDWTNITNKPTSFTPSAHASTHASGGSDALTLAQSQVTNLTTDLAGKAAAVHTHLLADITDYTDPTIYIDGGAANTVYAAYAGIDGGSSGTF